MGRDEVINHITRMLAWQNSPNPDAAGLSALCAENVVVPIPYPGSTPDFAGLLQVTQKVHKASPDWNIALKEMVIDETENKVVCLCNCTGTQVGYIPLLISMLIVENGWEFREVERSLIRWGL